MRNILWRLVNLLQFVVLLIWTLWWIVVAFLVYLVTGNRRRSLAVARRIWGPSTLALLGGKLEVAGRHRFDFSQAHLVAANHESLIDIPTLFAALPTGLRFLAKQELKQIPFLGWYATTMGMVYIDRHDSGAAAASIDQVSDLLNEAESLVSFPEGTRSRSGEVEPFKTGVFVAAIKAGVPVVPVAISGAAQVLPPDGLRFRPGVIRVVIGRPIPTVSLSLEDRRELADEVRKKIVELRATCRTGC
ncbi:MAG: lysophospholipid acyltransferase family protein [Thermoanaerobaculia bacterium]